MKIITFTEPRTGSTLVSNVVTGLFEQNLPISFFKMHVESLDDVFNSDRVTFKTHGCQKGPVAEQINRLVNKPYPETVYFIYINRYKTYEENHSQVLTLDYKNLLYKSIYNPESELTLKDVVKHIASCCENVMNLKINEKMMQNAADRITQMDELYEKIKKEPFSYYNEFYHIHGSHRNRNNKN